MNPFQPKSISFGQASQQPQTTQPTSSVSAFGSSGASGFGFGQVSVFGGGSGGSVFGSSGGASVFAGKSTAFPSFGMPVTTSVFGQPSASTHSSPAGSLTAPNTPSKAPSTSLKSTQLFQSLNKDTTREDERQKRFTVQSDIGAARDQMKRERDEREKRFYENYKPVQLSEARTVVGTCQDMCPEFERYDREVTQELHIFEIVQGTENDPYPRVDHQLAVKKYRRSAAGKDPEIFPEDIRPPVVLKRTMDYLVDKILTRTDQDYVEVYNFIRDRGRALRKDFKIQSQLKGEYCVDVLERMTRFLIHSDYILCELPESKFSWKQNRHQIVDTLTTLMEVYDDEAQRQKVYPNEAEFRAYFLLLMIDDSVTIDRYQRWRLDVRNSEQVKHAVKLHQSFQSKLYQFYFKLFKSDKTSYLMACLLNSSLSQARKDVLYSLFDSTPSKDKPVPARFLKHFMFLEDDDDLTRVCELFGLERLTEDNCALVRLGSREKIEYDGIIGHVKCKAVLAKANNLGHAEVVNGKGTMSMSDGVSVPPFAVPAHAAKYSFTFSQPPAVQVQKQVFKVPEVPKVKLKPDYTNDIKLLCDDILEQVVSIVSRDICNEAVHNRRTMKNVTRSVLDDVLVLASNEIIKLIMTQEIQAHVYKNQIKKDEVLSHTKLVLQQALHELVHEAAAEELSVSFAVKWRKKRALNKWKLFRHKKIEKRLELERIRMQNIENLRSIPLLLPTRPPPTPKKGSSPMKKRGNNESAINDFKLVETLLSAFKHNLDFRVVPYIKMLVSPIVSSKHSTDSIFLDGWLERNLSQQKVPDELHNSHLKTLTFAESSSKDSRLIVLIQKTLDFQRIQLSGVNCALFHLFVESLSDLDEIRQKLLDFAASLKPGSEAILVVFYWTRASLPSTQLESQFEFSSLYQEHRVTYVKFIQAGCLTSGVDQDEARKQLSRALSFLSSHLPTPPAISTKPIEDFIQKNLSSLFEYAEIISKQACKYQQSVAFSLNQQLKLWNCLINAYEQCVSSKDLIKIDFPPKELLEFPIPGVDNSVLPPIGWNSKVRIESLKDKLNQFKLPLLDDNSDFNQVTQFIESYTGLRKFSFNHQEENVSFQLFRLLVGSLMKDLDQIEAYSTFSNFETLNSRLLSEYAAIAYSFQPKRKFISAEPEDTKKIRKDSSFMKLLEKELEKISFLKEEFK